MLSALTVKCRVESVKINKSKDQDVKTKDKNEINHKEIMNEKQLIFSPMIADGND